MPAIQVPALGAARSRLRISKTVPSPQAAATGLQLSQYTQYPTTPAHVAARAQVERIAQYTVKTATKKNRNSREQKSMASVPSVCQMGCGDNFTSRLTHRAGPSDGVYRCRLCGQPRTTGRKLPPAWTPGSLNHARIGTDRHKSPRCEMCRFGLISLV